MQQEEVKELLKRYSEGTATAEEKALIEAWYAHFDDREQIINEAYLQSIEDNVFSRLPIHEQIPVRRMWPKIVAAASVVIALSAGSYLFLHKTSNQQITQKQQHDIAPGRNQATLTLANGLKIVLTRGLNGKLAQQGNIAINVNRGNAIAYQANLQNTQESAVIYNTLSTAKAEQSPYPLIMADGSKVWLNAASSITFPTAFNGKERIVKVTGEAYFEVVHNTAHPFKVQVGDQMIEDIGTHFNIKAYTDEPAITTTLLEGAVKVTQATQSVNLMPGQQSTVTHGNLSRVPDADVRLAMGWREGYFRFKDAGIDEFMRQLARWYDVDVVYEGKIPKFSFTGSLREDMKASQAMQVLDIFKVHYKIENKKIIITPK